MTMSPKIPTQSGPMTVEQYNTQLTGSYKKLNDTYRPKLPILYNALNIVEKAQIKNTIITLAKEHKEKCHTVDACGISLMWALIALEKLGISVTQDEISSFT